MINLAHISVHVCHFSRFKIIFPLYYFTVIVNKDFLTLAMDCQLRI